RRIRTTAAGSTADQAWDVTPVGPISRSGRHSSTSTGLKVRPDAITARPAATTAGIHNGTSRSTATTASAMVASASQATVRASASRIRNSATAESAIVVTQAML